MTEFQIGLGHKPTGAIPLHQRLFWMKANVLVTGASSGIGLELARQFARHGHSLVLTARVESELMEIAEELRANHGVVVDIIARDLREPLAAQQIFDATEGAGRRIDILVNDAGLGFRGKFWEIPLESEEEIINVNISALVRLTRLFLPVMVSRGSGRVLNVASVAGFEPGPLLAVYHASKAFVLSLSEALSVELDGTGVGITALCPGPTDTDFFPKADMVDTKAFQKAHVMPPQEVAEEGYEALMRGDNLYVAGGANKAMVFKRRFLTVRGQAKANRKLYERSKQVKRSSGEIRQKAAQEQAEQTSRTE